MINVLFPTSEEPALSLEFIFEIVRFPASSVKDNGKWNEIKLWVSQLLIDRMGSEPLITHIKRNDFDTLFQGTI